MSAATNEQNRREHSQGWVAQRPFPRNSNHQTRTITVRTPDTYQIGQICCFPLFLLICYVTTEPSLCSESRLRGYETDVLPLRDGLQTYLKSVLLGNIAVPLRVSKAGPWTPSLQFKSA